MGKCAICDLENSKAFLFKPSNKWMHLCQKHFDEYNEYSDRTDNPDIEDWYNLKKKENL